MLLLYFLQVSHVPIERVESIVAVACVNCPVSFLVMSPSVSGGLPCLISCHCLLLDLVVNLYPVGTNLTNLAIATE